MSRGEIGFAIVIGIALLIEMILFYANHVKSQRVKRAAAEWLNSKICADELLDRARILAQTANVEQDHAVCEKCERITTRYVRDENGITCINCAVDHART